MSEHCIRCFVSGRVQGVFFRSCTRDRAVMLGVHGGVRNLPDGRVEVVARGTPEQLQNLREWLHQGPPAARVEAVHCGSLEQIPPDYTADIMF